MIRVIFFLVISFQVNAQINYTVDTVMSMYSERDPLAAGEIFRYHYFLDNKDFEIKRSEIPYDKYHPFRRVNSSLKRDGKLVEIEDLIQIKSGEQYSFIFPFAFYNLKKDLLLTHGLEITGKIGSLDDLGWNPKLFINFYNNERAVHSQEYESDKIEGEVFKRIIENIQYDRIEIIIQNKWKDTLRMNFYLREY